MSDTKSGFSDKVALNFSKIRTKVSLRENPPSMTMVNSAIKASMAACPLAEALCLHWSKALNNGQLPPLIVITSSIEIVVVEV